VPLIFQRLEPICFNSTARIDRGAAPCSNLASDFHDEQLLSQPFGSIPPPLPALALVLTFMFARLSSDNLCFSLAVVIHPNTRAAFDSGFRFHRLLPSQTSDGKTARHVYRSTVRINAGAVARFDLAFDFHV
jgi:hypothetical protein